MKTDKIVIVGGGSAGWMTAATLIKAFPERDISVIESPDVPSIGVGESTLGQINRWMKYLEIDDDDFIPFVNGTYKMSIKFTDFYKKDSGSFHYPFGRPYREDTESPIEDWHIVKYFHPELKQSDMVDMLFPAAQLFNSNRFSDNVDGEFNDFDPIADVAYHFDAVRFGVWLKEMYCLPRGVKHIEKHVEAIAVNEDGIEYLMMKDGETITSDLFIDCTGFKSLLLSGALKEPFIPYDHILFNNAAWAVQIPYIDKELELQPYTNCTAIENGWCWNIPLWTRIGTGYNYSTKFVSDEDALEQLKNYLCSDKMTIPRSREYVESLTFRNLKTRVGIQERSWVKNVVAIGLSSGFIEPLESNGLFSVHEFLFILVDILQKGNVNQFDRSMYNTEIKDMFDGFAKFVSMHYAMSSREDTPYWKAISNHEFTEGTDRNPHTEFMHRSAAFYSAARLFFDTFKSRDDLSGMNYISVGLGYNLFNSARVSRLESYVGKDKVIEKAELLYDKMISNVSRWSLEAEKSPKIIDYMRDRFYNNE
jgi:tryptophan halogenase